MRSNNMRKISIVFTKSLKKFPIGSWIIRAWTSKEYSHVALKFETKVFNSIRPRLILVKNLGSNRKFLGKTLPRKNGTFNLIAALNVKNYNLLSFKKLTL